MKKNFVLSPIFILLVFTQAFATDTSSLDCNKEFKPTALSADESAAILKDCNSDLQNKECLDKKAREKQQQKINKALYDCPDSQSTAHKSAIKESRKLVPTYDLPSSTTTEPWLISLSLGQQYLPDYSTGKNEGFNHSQAFAEVILDNRVVRDNGQKIHWGTMLTFEGQPINAEQAKSPSEVEFTDVADTLTAGIYGIYMFQKDKDKDKDKSYEDGWGAAARFSLRSRESIGEKKDTLDEIGEVGVHYRYNTVATSYGNVMPKATLSIGGGYWNNYEDYMSETDVAIRWRFLFRGEYRLADNLPFYLGIRGSAGPGADSIATYLSLRVSTNKLLSLLSDQ